jgi:hypothetical protein
MAMKTRKQTAKKLLIILAVAVIALGVVGVIALLGTQSAYAFYGVSDRTATTEYRYSVCTETGCADTSIHTHAGIVYYGHDVRDGHAYHSCGVAGCVQGDSHFHNSCDVSGCYTTESHSHENARHQNTHNSSSTAVSSSTAHDSGTAGNSGTIVNSDTAHNNGHTGSGHGGGHH